MISKEEFDRLASQMPYLWNGQVLRMAAQQFDLKLELLVAWSEVYSVPVLYIEQARRNDAVLSFAELSQLYPVLEMGEMTLARHTIMLPCISPCNTVQIMHELHSRTNYLDSWLSVYLPMLQQKGDKK